MFGNGDILWKQIARVKGDPQFSRKQNKFSPSAKAVERDKSKLYLSKLWSWLGPAPHRNPQHSISNTGNNPGNKNRSFPRPLLSGDVYGLCLCPPTVPISQSLRHLLLPPALERRNVFPSAAGTGLRSSLYSQALQAAAWGCAREGLRGKNPTTVCEMDIKSCKCGRGRSKTRFSCPSLCINVIDSLKIL